MRLLPTHTELLSATVQKHQDIAFFSVLGNTYFGGRKQPKLNGVT